MLSSIFGKKIGMTQIFSKEGKVFPVTAIDVGNLIVTQIKTDDCDGYSALQIGLLKNKYKGSSLPENWLKNKKNFCSIFKEVKVASKDLSNFKLGQAISLNEIVLSEMDKVKITGTSRGLGFQGVVKRWGFAGGPASHGSNFHRIPGAISGLRSQGEVIKGKKMPGRAGFLTVSIKNMKVVKIDKENSVLFVRGAVPGKCDSLVLISKQG